MSTDALANADIARRRQKLRRISHIAEWIALGAIALVLSYCVYSWWSEVAQAAFLKRDVPGLVIPPTAGVARLAYWISILPAGIFALAMWEARQLFRLFGTGNVFGRATPRHLLRLGFLAIAAAIAGMIVRALVILLMTSANPPGQQHLVLRIGSNELAALVAGLLFLAFALVMQEALRIEEDNLSIV